MQDTKVWGAFLLLGSVWGSSFMFIKIGLESLDPFTLVALRVSIGALGLWTIIALTQGKLPRDRRTIVNLIIVGAVNTAIPFVLITWGEKFIASSVAGILNATTPLYTIIIAHFALSDERITWLRFAGLVVGFAGVVLIFSQDLLGGLAEVRAGASVGVAFGNVQGQLAVVVAAICYALATTYTRRHLRHVQPLVVAGGTQVVASTMVAVSAVIFESPFANPISGRSWFAVGWLGLLGSCLAYILFYFIIREWGATRASLVTYILPVVAFVLGALVLDEVITWQVFVGGLLIIAGIAIVNRRARVAETAGKPVPQATS